jgi:hypothetical protein
MRKRNVPFARSSAREGVRKVSRAHATVHRWASRPAARLRFAGFQGYFRPAAVARAGKIDALLNRPASSQRIEFSFTIFDFFVEERCSAHGHAR